MVEVRRWWHGVERDHLRREIRYRLHRYRQRQRQRPAMKPQDPQSRRRQPLPLFHPRTQCENRSLQWHYQINHAESRDYNAAMSIELAILDIDCVSGKLLSAGMITKVTWAERIDIASGRPMKHPASVTKAAWSSSGPAAPARTTGTRWTSIRRPVWSTSRPSTCPTATTTAASTDSAGYRARRCRAASASTCRATMCRSMPATAFSRPGIR